MTSLDFELSANNDVTLGLSSVNMEKRDMREIGQDFSGDCAITITVKTPNILSGYGIYNRFWITFRNNTIAVGRHGDSTPFLAATYPTLMDINYVGVHTGYGSEGYWKFHSFC
ncbi:uncharacterized protein [Diadema antillarum]|uniref:uncharacterized protein n=1 Tax=Diadema antillarum TaxID=105358 RepID=UPI003A87966E